MKNKILLAIVVILSFVNIVVIGFKNKPNHSFFSEEKNIKIKDEENNISELNIEEYLIGVLAAEMPASFEIEALKAQAVAARTYALYKIEHSANKDYNVLTNTTDQSYISKEEMKEKWQNDYEKYYTKIKSAIEDTKNEAIFYNNDIIEAFYFSMSNGKTEESETVFQESLPYIESVDSRWDNENLSNFVVTKELSKNDFCQKLSLNNCEIINITGINKSEGNRINTITINDKEFMGTTIRKLLNLRSTDFDISINNNTIYITTKGYGHGVGMSQYGANGMAKEGYDYKEILNHYYQNITIKKIV